MRVIASQISVESKLEIATLDKLLVAEAHYFPYEKVFADVVDDPILVVHSSGTTGQSRTGLS